MAMEKKDMGYRRDYALPTIQTFIKTMLCNIIHMNIHKYYYVKQALKYKVTWSAVIWTWDESKSGICKLKLCNIFIKKLFSLKLLTSSFYTYINYKAVYIIYKNKKSKVLVK